MRKLAGIADRVEFGENGRALLLAPRAFVLGKAEKFHLKKNMLYGASR